ncbi:MAG: hypothetical protein QM731_18315 [Chitinophagaceae bacterium]
MRAIYNILKNPFFKSFLAAGMILLLLFLTSVNYFRFPDRSKDASAWVTDSQDSNSNDNPAGPDEKSPSANAFSFTEEYIHENHHTINPFWTNNIFLHQIHTAGKVSVVHFELLSPPPEA